MRIFSFDMLPCLNILVVNNLIKEYLNLKIALKFQVILYFLGDAIINTCKHKNELWLSFLKSELK